jgi:hypothetical protein
MVLKASAVATAKVDALFIVTSVGIVQMRKG